MAIPTEHLNHNQEVILNPTVDRLLHDIEEKGEGIVTEDGLANVLTGRHTGRAVHDRYIVYDDETADTVDWSRNKPLDEHYFNQLKRKVLDYYKGQRIYRTEASMHADPRYAQSIAMHSDTAAGALFTRHILRAPSPTDRNNTPDISIYSASNFHADPSVDGTDSETCIAINLTTGESIHVGSGYNGEKKKDPFSRANYFLPEQGVFPMHCSAIVTPDGKVSVIFGLSGTGKTSMSALGDLIGDDMHGWSPNGVFNMEGGMYAKCIGLDPEKEPEIYRAAHMRGALFENIDIDPRTGKFDFSSNRYTENTRVAFPLENVPHVPDGTGDHPSTIILLTADAHGATPPISRLTPEQAQYWYLLAPTSTLAGTVDGAKEPRSTYSTGFGADFLPRHPKVYADMFKQKLEQHPNTNVFLVNTGWIGGQYGVGERIPIEYTKRMLDAAFSGELDPGNVAYQKDPRFGVRVPEGIAGVPPDILDQSKLWKNPAAYEEQANRVAGEFEAEFTKRFPGIPRAVAESGPHPL